MKRNLKGNYFLVVSFATAVLFLNGCATKNIAPISLEDNPEHHYNQGMLSLEKGDISTAEAKFQRALNLDGKYNPALVGMSLAIAMKSPGRAVAEHRQLDIEQALDYLKKAQRTAERKYERFIVYTTAIRVYTSLKPNNWVRKAEAAFQKANKIEELALELIPYYQHKIAASYFMGQAFLEAYQFRKAEDKFALVLAQKPQGKWHTLANEDYKKIQKILRAAANATIGKVAQKIAVKDAVSRMDVSALLVDEMKLDRLFSGRIPIESQVADREPEFTPIDIKDSPFKMEILTILKWDLRGLEPQYDESSRAYLFRPRNSILRKELAMALEDILMRLTGEKDLATKYIGVEQSPFPDVKATSVWFNAVTTSVSRGLMETKLSGEFSPDEYVDGASLLLAVFKLKNVLNIY